MPDRIAPTHGVVVLAAGSSSRLGTNKLLLQHDDEAFARRAVRLALATAPGDAVVVLGAEGDRVFGELAGLCVRRVDCANWAEGMGASLQTGLNALAENCDAALVVVCDQPELQAAHLQALCTAWRATPQKAVASRYMERLGVPAVLPRAWFAGIQARGDQGARGLFVDRPSEVVAIANDSLGIDIDTPVDLEAFERARPRRRS